MSEIKPTITVEFPICNSCRKPIPPGERGTSFLCPNCGSYTIWRCKSCRKQSIKYVCPNCGFTGP